MSFAALGIWALLAAGPGREGAYTRRGNMLLSGGSNDAAVAVFAQQLERTPDAPAAHVGMGKALARIGRCAEALEHLGPQVGTTPFGHEAALSAGQCAARLGFDDEARYYFEAALQADADSTRALTYVALLFHHRGDVAACEAALDELALARRGRDASWYAQAAMALGDGNIDGFDVIVAQWRHEQRESVDMLVLLAKSWLDMGDPQEALAVLEPIRTLKGARAARAVRAEAARRTGYPETALALVEDRPISVLEGDGADAISARIFTDLGRIAEARALLGDPSQIDDPEQLASAWYVARRTGNAAEAEELGERYERVRDSPRRTLDDLVPLGRPAAPHE